MDLPAYISFRRDIIKAYVFLRGNNNDIPDQVLDFIRDSALSNLDKITERKVIDG